MYCQSNNVLNHQLQKNTQENGTTHIFGPKILLVKSPKPLRTQAFVSQFPHSPGVAHLRTHTLFRTTRWTNKNRKPSYIFR